MHVEAGLSVGRRPGLYNIFCSWGPATSRRGRDKKDLFPLSLSLHTHQPTNNSSS